MRSTELSRVLAKPSPTFVLLPDTRQRRRGNRGRQVGLMLLTQTRAAISKLAVGAGVNGESGKILPQLSSIISQRQGQIPACITRHFLSDITRVTSKSFYAKLEMPCSMLASTCGERRDHKVTQAGRSHVACFDTNPLTSQTWPGESKALGLFAMRAGYFALISNTLR